VNTPATLPAALYPVPEYVKHLTPTPEYTERVAWQHENAPTFDLNEHIARSYASFKKEILRQFIHIRHYVDFTYHNGEHEYKNSAELVRDIEENRHAWIYATGDTLGNDEHPLAEVAIEHKGQDILYNDVFRAVHDYIAHAATGFQFGTIGEHRAYHAHKVTLSPIAHRALFIETESQNKWVNQAAHLHIPPAQRQYAIQKVYYPEYIA
jgi:hypothetical protein